METEDRATVFPAVMFLTGGRVDETHRVSFSTSAYKIYIYIYENTRQSNIR